MPNSLDDFVDKNGLHIHPDLVGNRTHRALVKQYERLQENAKERTWSKIKYKAYKWGVAVPFIYAAVGGELAKIWGERLGVKRKTAVLTHIAITSAVDTSWSLAADGALDTVFYVKMGITQGWNIYRLIHDEEKNPKLAIGFETIAAFAPYSKYLLTKSFDVVDEQIDGSKNLMKKALPKRIKEDYQLIKDYYKMQSFVRNQPVFDVALHEGLTEFTRPFKESLQLLKYSLSLKKQ